MRWSAALKALNAANGRLQPIVPTLSEQEERAMHPDFERSIWWAGAKNYLAVAHFNFERGADEQYTWYLLLGWAECMEELKEENT
jgi:hypothetical protein